MTDPRCQSSPAALRNRALIAAILRPLLPPTGLVLELASGTGEHVVQFAQTMPGLIWQPSDPSPVARASIAAWCEREGLANVRAPLDCDVTAATQPVEYADAIVCINMIHISPWAATLALMQLAGRILPRRGVLYLYGPYRRADRALEPGNAAFDADLRARNAAWGLRDLDAVVAVAAAQGLHCEDVIDMPANNVSVVLRRV